MFSSIKPVYTSVDLAKINSFREFIKHESNNGNITTRPIENKLHNTVCITRTNIVTDEVKKGNEYLHSVSSINRMTGTDFINQATKKVFKVSSSISINKAIEFTATIAKELDKLLYGVLLINNNNSKEEQINLLHPIIAKKLSSIDRNNVEYDVQMYSLYVYYHVPTTEEELNMDEYYIGRGMSDIESVLAYSCESSLYSTSLLVDKFYTSNDEPPKSYNNIVESMMTDFKTRLSYQNNNYGYFYLKKDEYLTDYQGNKFSEYYAIVPVQAIVSNIIAPYYGTVIVHNKNNHVKGYQTNSMLSANISSGEAVCTGTQHRNTSIPGLETLNKSNQNSPYIRDNVLPGWKELAYVSIKTSLQLYEASAQGERNAS